MPKRPYPCWQRRHEAVLIWLVEHPAGKLEECARVTGYSRSHLSRITCSPDFCRQLGGIRAELERQVLTRVMDRLTPKKLDKDDKNNVALVRYDPVNVPLAPGGRRNQFDYFGWARRSIPVVSAPYPGARVPAHLDSSSFKSEPPHRLIEQKESEVEAS